MPRSKVKPSAVTENSMPEVFIIPDTVIDAHAQPSEHDADQTGATLATVPIRGRASSPSRAGPRRIVEVMTRKPWGRVGCLRYGFLAAARLGVVCGQQTRGGREWVEARLGPIARPSTFQLSDGFHQGSEDQQCRISADASAIYHRLDDLLDGDGWCDPLVAQWDVCVSSYPAIRWLCGPILLSPRTGPTTPSTQP